MALRTILLASALCGAAAYNAGGALRPARRALPARSSPVALLEPLVQASLAVDAAPAAVEHVSSLLANEATQVDVTSPVFLLQMATFAGMIVGGYGLEEFGDVEEPQEEGVVEGEVDIYRDSLLRYAGYLNEVGEAFRPLVPVAVVYFSYVLAISYILADTFDKYQKGVAAGEASGDGQLRGGLGAVDTFVWQMLASVTLPSFCINRLVVLLVSIQLPEVLQADWIPTAIGLAAIPLLITPLDVLAHWTLNGSLRKTKEAALAKA